MSDHIAEAPNEEERKMAERIRSAKSTTRKTAKKAAARPRPRTDKGEEEGAALASAADRASQLAELGDWRKDVLRQVRKLIRDADPEIIEEVKWRKPSNPAGVPVWSRNGIVCTGETHKNHVKLTFAKGAALVDPAALFNAGQGGHVRRAIDIHDGDEIDESAFKDLIRAAVALNLSGKKK
jgi:hypothetical protein